MKQLDLRMIVFIFVLLIVSSQGILMAQDSVDVTFYYKAEGFPSGVFLPGEFNSWNMFADPMTYNGNTGQWQRTKRLRVGGPVPPPSEVSVPGAYQYKFNLNGNDQGWMNDPLNPKTNPFDHDNSYLYIQDPTIHYLLPNSLSGLVESPYPLITAYIFPSTTSSVITSSIRVTIDDVTYENIGDGYNLQTKQFSFTPTEPIVSGMHKLKLYVQSTNGTVGEDSTEFISQAGFIQFLTQSNQHYLHPTIKIIGTTAEPDLDVIFEYIGEESSNITSDSTGMFSQQVTLAEGENRFQATTMDNEDVTHETGILKINYFIDHAPKPVITVKADEENVTFTAVGNDPDADSVSYHWISDDDINPEPLNINSHENSVVISLPGTSGEYFVDLSATDPDENVGYSRTYFTIKPDGSGEASTINSNISWIQDALIYEIFLISFTPEGTIAAAEDRLEYIKSLGANTIWLMPIYETGSVIGELDAGYGISDFYKVHPQFGTLDDLKSFLTKAHSLGIHVILDSTPNHTGERHTFLQNVALFEDYSNFRPIYETELLGDDRGMGQFRKIVDDYTLYVHYSNWSLPNIDYTNIESKDYMINMYKYWVVDVGVDGYRLDVYWGPNNRYGKDEWWRPFREEMKRVRPEALLLGETDGTGVGSENNYADGGGALDAANDWTLYGQFKDALSGGSIGDLDDKVTNYSPNMRYNYHTGANAHYFRFLENHDETRIADLFSIPKTRVGAALLYTIPGLPMIYAGQEVGETSRRGDINWNREGAEELTAYYTRLGEIRNTFPAFRSDLLQRESTGTSKLYSYVRPYLDQNGIAIHNFSSANLTATLAITENDLFLSDSLESGQVYYMNDVLNDTVYPVTTADLERFQSVVPSWTSRIFILADSVLDIIDDIENVRSLVLPQEFALQQNYPNPFNPETQISFTVPEMARVSLRIYDILGREVTRLVDSEKVPGTYSYTWNGTNMNGNQVGSGVYFYTLFAHSGGQVLFSESHKMIFIK